MWLVAKEQDKERDVELERGKVEERQSGVEREWTRTESEQFNIIEEEKRKNVRINQEGNGEGMARWWWWWWW